MAADHFLSSSCPFRRPNPRNGREENRRNCLGYPFGGGEGILRKKIMKLISESFFKNFRTVSNVEILVRNIHSFVIKVEFVSL